MVDTAKCSEVPESRENKTERANLDRTEGRDFFSVSSLLWFQAEHKAPGPTEEVFRFLSYLQVSPRDVDSGVWKRTWRGWLMESRRTYKQVRGLRGRREASPPEASWRSEAAWESWRAGTAWHLVHSIRFCPTRMGRTQFKQRIRSASGG